MYFTGAGCDGILKTGAGVKASLGLKIGFLDQNRVGLEFRKKIYLSVKFEYFLFFSLNIFGGAQKYRLIGTVLLSAHKICLVKKYNFYYVITPF